MDDNTYASNQQPANGFPPQDQPMPPSQPQPNPGQTAWQPPTPQPAQNAQPGQAPAGGQQRNPLKIDDNLLLELGLGALPEGERRALQKHIYETLEMNVGMRLADQMTDQQLDEFEAYFNARDDAGAFRWLETNFPNYKDIVAEEFQKLKMEVGRQAPQILAASQQQAQSPPAPQPPLGYQEPSAAPAQQYGPPATPQAGQPGQAYYQPPQAPPAPNPYQQPTDQGPPEPPPSGSGY